MICVSIQNKNLEEIFDILDTVEMAEIRLLKSLSNFLRGAAGIVCIKT